MWSQTASERGFSIGQRQEVVVVVVVVRGPGQMLGEHSGLKPPIQLPEAFQMFLVRGLLAADRKSNAVARKRKILPQAP